MKKVGKKSIKGRRMVQSSTKNPARASTLPKVSVKDAKAASKKIPKKAKAAHESDEGEDDKEMTHTEVNEVSEEVDEQINT